MGGHVVKKPFASGSEVCLTLYEGFQAHSDRGREVSSPVSAVLGLGCHGPLGGGGALSLSSSSLTKPAPVLGSICPFPEQELSEGGGGGGGATQGEDMTSFRSRVVDTCPS
jgi:hypothetical protein